MCLSSFSVANINSNHESQQRRSLVPNDRDSSILQRKTDASVITTKARVYTYIAISVYRDHGHVPCLCLCHEARLVVYRVHDNHHGIALVSVPEIVSDVLRLYHHAADYLYLLCQDDAMIYYFLVYYRLYDHDHHHGSCHFACSFACQLRPNRTAGRCFRFVLRFEID